MKTWKLHAEKTERGWELADATGTFESLETSLVYATRKDAESAARQFNSCNSDGVSHAEQLREAFAGQ